MRLSRSLVLAALLSVGAAPAAQAQVLFSGTYTGGNSFNTTASMSLSYSAVDAGVYLFSLNMMNLGTYGEVYRSIGLFNLPSTLALLDSWTNLDGWHLPPPDDFSGDVLTAPTVSFISPNPGPKKGLMNDGTLGMFQFKVGGFTSLSEVMAVGAGVHAISGPNGCSTKLGVQAGKVLRTADGSSGCVGVPEPASGPLMATGVLGLLGFAWIRRRRGQVIVWEEAA